LYFGHGATNASDEAAWIAAHACRISPLRLPVHAARRMGAGEVERANAVVDARIAGRKPLAYLLGEAWLAGKRFVVDERVIVPRSLISEWLPGRFAPWIARPDSVERVLDLCTGSGCLAILAAQAFRTAKVDALDISDHALAVARANIRLHRLAGRVRALRSDLFAAVGGTRPRKYDLILSNPPYVDAPSMRTLPDEYRREPRIALAGGKDGLALVKKILRAARKHLAPGGALIVEIGHNRRALERAFPRTPFLWLETSAGEDKVFLLGAEDLP
jgi:ribosomal protein L3 glutamine methyltransferase